ncbi:MAG: SGNH/GDSL hydrolase family protein [Phycisphaerae bacterium]
MLTARAFGYLADYVLWWLLFFSLVVHTWCFFKFFPRERRRGLALVLGNLLVLLCLLGAVGLAGESYFRFVCVETDAYGVSLPARRWFVLNTKLNSLGCRDVEWSTDKPPGVRRIAFIGDSFTYGWGIERVEDRFTDMIGARLNQRSPGTYEVMNVAKPGWDTKAQLTPLRDIISQYSVDEIVLCYVANDLDTLLPGSGDSDPLRVPEPLLFDPDRSCLVDYLYRTLYLPRLPAVREYKKLLARAYADDAIRRQQGARLLAIREQCLQQGVELRVVLLPMLQMLNGDFDHGRVLSLLGEVFEPRQIRVLDLLPALNGYAPADLTLNRRDAHPNALAHKLFAEAMWQAFYETPTS